MALLICTYMPYMVQIKTDENRNKSSESGRINK